MRAVGIALFIVASACLGYAVTHYGPQLIGSTQSDVVYQVDSEKNSDHAVASIGWEALIPDADKQILQKYQGNQGTDLESLSKQILNSINAASDERYQEALISTSTVDTLTDTKVSLSGFLVPVDFYDNQQIKTAFLVPYFGACIHFPPPPPNQMVYVQLEPGLERFSLNQAYTTIGEIKPMLYEDPMGTSAYGMQVYTIKEFHGQPDDVRNHNG